ncbi:hypothetical protein Sjap_004065 [Stephania japonica]|uniref:Uncharacterized protein n=1 Tax=Stephania japonica TaxID=461633 RepID=A0AAP0K1K2_9MAGN
MEFFFRDASGELPRTELNFDNQDVQRCPFLRNINIPTNFSLLSSVDFAMPLRGTKGPIFEDGPSFDSAFRLFHGRDGIVPLSGRSYSRQENLEAEPEPALQFNPLAAKAASISLSSLWPGGPFGFDGFSEKWKKQKRKPTKQGGDSSSHEAMGDEWLKTGNCPIAKSYRAVSHVVPLIAKVFQPPPGMKFRCPPAVVAARATLARTAFVKTLRPQPLPAKMLAIAMLGMAANIPLGIWREHTDKFSLSWFVAVHAAVPFIAMLRKSVVMPKTAMAITIGASVLGQVIGSRAERHRIRTAAEREVTKTPVTIGLNSTEIGFIKSACNHCGSEKMALEPLSVKATRSTSSTDVCC